MVALLTGALYLGFGIWLTSQDLIFPDAMSRVANGYYVVFSREAVTRPAACGPQPGHDRNLNCHGYGSAVTVTATFGLVAAGWMLERLAQGRALQHPHT